MLLICLFKNKEMSFLCSWSGGKDSCYAYYLAVKQGWEPKVLLNVLNEHGDRSRSHGIPKNILTAQAQALDVPIHFFEATWAAYEASFIKNLVMLKDQYGLSTAVYGDIDIESHRAWEEKVSAEAGLEAKLPLWKGSRRDLVEEMLDTGIEAMIVSCNNTLGKEFLGRTLDKNLIQELEALQIDVCGENGEYHTLVLNAPMFKQRLQVSVVGVEKSSNYNFASLILDAP
ncbi:uncharacterized protein (TIGR00290 family) [Aquimarina intermedia]|uniref:Uncharacterized protein (TIGR00290 family) n=2 Tax=Aquimarina intermedia TaxID=350814 RepID=A0A5S5BX08_9FLAO|nr:uncharacterized protein (TIGR00290 family) [Aquimarina intermedia]